MKTIRMYGASDDLVEVEGTDSAIDRTAAPDNSENVAGPGGQGGEFNVTSEEATFIIGGQVRVFSVYDGTWSFAVGMVDEDTPLPWPVRVQACPEVAYSVEVLIEVPNDRASIVRVT